MRLNELADRMAAEGVTNPSAPSYFESGDVDGPLLFSWWKGEGEDRQFVSSSKWSEVCRQWSTGAGNRARARETTKDT